MPSFTIIPERISRHPKYKTLQKYIRIYQFVASIIALVVFVAYLVTLANTLTTAHGIVLTIAVCSLLYTAISTALIFLTSFGGDLVDVVRWGFDLLLLVGWAANTGIMGSESASCGGGSSNESKRNDSDDDSGCGLLNAVVAASALTLIGFLFAAVMTDTSDLSKLNNPLKDPEDVSQQQGKSVRLSRTDGYESVNP